MTGLGGVAGKDIGGIAYREYLAWKAPSNILWRGNKERRKSRVWPSPCGPLRQHGKSRLELGLCKMNVKSGEKNLRKGGAKSEEGNQPFKGIGWPQKIWKWKSLPWETP